MVGLPIVFEEHHRLRAAAQRLESKRSGSGEDVGYVAARELLLDAFKQNLFDLVGDWPRDVAGAYEQLSTTIFPGDDSQRSCYFTSVAITEL